MIEHNRLARLESLSESLLHAMEYNGTSPAADKLLGSLSNLEKLEKQDFANATLPNCATAEDILNEVIRRNFGNEAISEDASIRWRRLVEPLVFPDAINRAIEKKSESVTKVNTAPGQWKVRYLLSALIKRGYSPSSIEVIEDVSPVAGIKRAPYCLINIDGLERSILVSNQQGQATFVISRNTQLPDTKQGILAQGGLRLTSQSPCSWSDEVCTALRSTSRPHFQDPDAPMFDTNEQIRNYFAMPEYLILDRLNFDPFLSDSATMKQEVICCNGRQLKYSEYVARFGAGHYNESITEAYKHRTENIDRMATLIWPFIFTREAEFKNIASYHLNSAQAANDIEKINNYLNSRNITASELLSMDSDFSIPEHPHPFCRSNATTNSFLYYLSCAHSVFGIPNAPWRGWGSLNPLGAAPDKILGKNKEDFLVSVMSKISKIANGSNPRDLIQSPIYLKFYEHHCILE